MSTLLISVFECLQYSKNRHDQNSLKKHGSVHTDRNTDKHQFFTCHFLLSMIVRFCCLNIYLCEVSYFPNKCLFVSAPLQVSKSFSDSSIESVHPRFEFRNQVTATADPPDSMLTREQIQTILKRILFEPEGTDYENMLITCTIA